MGMRHKETSLTDQIGEILVDVLHQELEEVSITMLDEGIYQINDTTYKLAMDFREGFDIEALKKLYDPFFEKYDFIVGDWGHEKLRLRGFYQLNTPKVPKDQQIDFLDDYLKEYCNFGCAYFVLAKESAELEYNKLKENYSTIHKGRPKKGKSQKHQVSTRNKNEQHKKKDSQFKKTAQEKPFKRRRKNRQFEKNTSKNKVTSNKTLSNNKDFVIKQRKV